MTSTCTLDGIVVDGVPPRFALHPYGGFTACVVSDGGVRGWSRHEDRLAQAALDLWGHELDREALRASVRRHLAAAGESCVAMRVTVYPADFTMLAPEEASGVRVLVTSTSADPTVRISDPLAVDVVEHERRSAHLKTTDLFAQIAIRRGARTAGFDDALLVSGGRVLEGVTWGVVLWRDGAAITPAGEVLPSVTVGLLEEVAHQLGHSFTRREVALTELREADLVLAVSVNHPARAVARVGQDRLRITESLLESVAGAYAALPLERI